MMEKMKKKYKTRDSLETKNHLFEIDLYGMSFPALVCNFCLQPSLISWRNETLVRCALPNNKNPKVFIALTTYIM